MTLERLTLAPAVLGSREDQDLNTNSNSNSSSKAPRLPRWTRQELLVLIQGKRVAENRVRRGRAAVMGFGSSGSQSQVEPKWSSVSSYCKRHGVNRGPVQCRKRWSNLAGDFKKIKEWESRKQQEAEDSFWVMRNDLRRERKLPGFFDREVYDILNDAAANNTTTNATTDDLSAANGKSLVLSLAPSEVQPEAKTVNEEVVFDSGRTAAAAADGLFSNDDDDNDDANNDDDNDDGSTPEKHKETALPPPTPISATQYNEPFSQGVSLPPPPAAATKKDKEATQSPETYQGRKRKRPATIAEETSLENRLIEAMERNSRLLSSQLEIQNTNSVLDREQRKDHAHSLFSVLNKLADAMVRIADKS